MIGNDQIDELAGTDVYGSDGDKIGAAGEVYLDYQTGRTEWISVRTGLFGMKESLVPLSQATVSNDRIEVPFTKDRVKGAPTIDVDGDLSPAEVDELYAYYGVGSASDGGDDRDTVGADRSAAKTDNAMTRSEERLTASTRTDEQVGYGPAAQARRHRAAAGHGAGDA